MVGKLKGKHPTIMRDINISPHVIQTTTIALHICPWSIPDLLASFLSLVRFNNFAFPSVGKSVTVRSQALPSIP